jgi:peptidoglycan/xylan/chitin deacetylase (PgdA/CDA1 family)
MSIVLMYHRVAETDLDPYNLAVSPPHFREHLSVLRRLTFPRQLLEIVDNWSDSNSGVAVTFDDGYADNLSEAVPALEAEEIPATIFVSTGILDRDGFWVDRLARCLLADREYPDVETLELDGRKAWIDLRTPEDRKAAHRYLHKNMRNLHPEVIDTKIAELANSLNIDPSPPASDRPLTSQEAAQLVSHSLIDLGGHTVYHPCLSRLKFAEQRWEIETCKATLHELGAPKVLAFAYPFGDRESYTSKTRGLVRKAGWHHAVISEPKQGLWFRRYAVPRQFVGDWDGDEFERRLRKWLGSG